MVEYDPYMREIKQDPLPIYKRMREECPVYRVERFGAWALARFEDVWQVSQDEAFFSSANGNADLGLLEGRPSALQTLASMDGAAHKRLRKALFPQFGPSAARRLSEPVRGWVRERLAAHAPAGRIDAVRELAQQIAVRVSCRISGLPVEDSERLLALVHGFFAREEGTQGMSAQGRLAVSGLWEYLETAARERRESARARGDALDTLIAYRGDDGEPLDDARIARHLLLLVVGATETFPKVFASALLRLWQHPAQRELLCREPARIPTALLEVLRYDTPTQWLGRTVVRDYALREHRFRAGEKVLFLFPSANRDELEFRDPDRFDIGRNPPRILTFGHGEHRCLGNHMAQMEGRVLLEELLARFPRYEVLSEELVRPPTEFVQGYTAFPIALRA